MFGKPEWFVPKKFGWGLTPVTKEGWIYAGVWLGVLLLPFLVLLFYFGETGLERGIKAFVWLGAMIAFLIFDVKLILRAMARKEEEKDVFRIMDEEETRQEEAETGKFAMHVTDSTRAKQA